MSFNSRSPVLSVFTLILFAVLLMPISAFSQNLEDAAYSSKYAAVVYDRTNGLPTSEANAILQTSDGFIWIGSYSGLIRYDGTIFYRYDASLGLSSIVSLFEDSRQRLWIGSNDNGLFVYENGNFKSYGKRDGLGSSSVRSICEDSEGNIFIATAFGMNYLTPDGELRLMDDSQLEGEYIKNLHSDPDGIIYGVTQRGNIFTIENTHVSSFFSGTSITDSTINCVVPDPKNKNCVYMGTSNSSVIYADLKNIENRKICSVAPQENVNSLICTTGSAWVCSDNGIGYITDDFAYTEFENLPINNSIDSGIIDYEGNMWFTSSRQGVLKIAPSQFINLQAIAGLPPMVVNSTCLYDDMLFIGSDTGLVVLDMQYNKINHPLSELLKDDRIRCIKADSKGRLWIATFSDHGLLCMEHDGSYTMFTQDTGLASNRVRTLEECPDGTIAVSCTNGVHIIDNGKIIKTYDNSTGISKSDILCIAGDKDGSLYLGSNGDGIFKIKDNNITCFGIDDNLRSEVILKMKWDEQNRLYWIITSNSIAYMKDDVITTITNFPYANNFDIYIDQNNGAWVLSSSGIYISSVSSLTSDEIPEYTFFDTKCGLPCVATANSNSVLDADGNLYISGSTGVILTNINDMAEDNNSIKLTVPFVDADGTMIPILPDDSGNGYEGTVTIPTNTKRISIYGYALTYSLKNPRVGHKLEGFDTVMTDVSKQDMRPISYTNLRGGEYTFHLAIINTITGLEENSININIVKTKAFYERSWFWLIVLIIAVFAVIVIVRVNIAHHIKKEHAMQEYVDEISLAFSKCIDAKDNYTRGHSARVAQYSMLIAEKLGKSKSEAHSIKNIALLHDIGKISIPNEILNKPGRLTDDEYSILKDHAQNGFEILKDITIMKDLAVGAGSHHERIDGRGYPNGLIGSDIPEIARIIAVADTFDAMYSTRPYRKQLPINIVIEELKRVSGSQLDEEIVNCLLELIAEGKIGKKDKENDNIDESADENGKYTIIDNVGR